MVIHTHTHTKDNQTLIMMNNWYRMMIHIKTNRSAMIIITINWLEMFEIFVDTMVHIIIIQTQWWLDDECFQIYKMHACIIIKQEQVRIRIVMWMNRPIVYMFFFCFGRIQNSVNVNSAAFFFICQSWPHSFSVQITFSFFLLRKLWTNIIIIVCRIDMNFLQKSNVQVRQCNRIVHRRMNKCSGYTYVREKKWTI